MKLQLPDVTLVLIESRCHVLARMAVQDTLDIADFGDVLIFSNKDLRISGATWNKVPDRLGDQAYNMFLWYGLPPYIRTSHMLLIQWDSWATNPECWTNAYLQHDYVGAPWWYTDGLNVGCGGFMLRSRRLMRYLAAHIFEYPVESPEDHWLCRLHRPQLEKAGFTWAPEPLAAQFAFECSRPSETSTHFGFHALRNWPLVLKGDRLRERVALAKADPYIGSTAMLHHLRQHVKPEIIRELAL